MLEKIPQGTLLLVRSQAAGVFFGEFRAADGATVQLSNARRIWYWDGAASLSQLAVTGTTKPKTCKFPIAVSLVWVTEVCEILAVTEEAQRSINNVPVWTA